jgi:hypothetical protein
LNIAEVSFFKNNIQLSNYLFTVTASSFVTYYGTPNAVNDNNINTLVHTCYIEAAGTLPIGCSGPDYHPYLNISVSDSYRFDSMTITNRQSACQDRMVGARVSVYHSTAMSHPLFSTSISAAQSSYTLLTPSIYG